MRLSIAQGLLFPAPGDPDPFSQREGANRIAGGIRLGSLCGAIHSLIATFMMIPTGQKQLPFTWKTYGSYIAVGTIFGITSRLLGKNKEAGDAIFVSGAGISLIGLLLGGAYYRVTSSRGWSSPWFVHGTAFAGLIAGVAHALK